MAIFKKIGFVVVYYLLASIVDQISMLYTGNIYVSFVISALCICATSVVLRNAQIIKRNYNQEQRDEYSKSFKSKFTHIVNALDFKVETTIGTVVCLIFIAIPRVASGACYAFLIIGNNRLYGLALIPLFVIANFMIWYVAYYKSFRKKKY